MNEQRNENQSLDCAVAQDLLPLYNDGVVSSATGEAIRRHLEHCKACRREYEDLREILPVRAEDFGTTKERFIAMERKLERRRIFRVLWVLLAIAALAVGVWYFLMEAPLWPEEKNVEEIVKTYRYQDDRGTHFLILYRSGAEEHGNGSIGHIEVGQEGSTCQLQEQWRTSVLGRTRSEPYGDYTDVCPEESGLAGKEPIKKLIYQGKVAWTEEENGDDPIPDYVPLYFEFRKSDWTGGPEARGWMNIYVEEGYVQAGFKDGKLILWSLDGELLYEGYPGGEKEGK